MNKVLNINLGGMPFTIDEDAYDHLQNYLKTIHNHFRSSDGYEEITADIEARIAELFQEKLGNRPIVTFPDLKHVIAIMGTPEDFGADSIGEEAPKSDSGKQWKFKTGKRLFKNPDDKVIGGVCSGVAAYFGIEEVVWVRLVFVLLTVSGGFGIPLYIILWAVLPSAKTAGDRLSMRGEPANVSNIGRIIEEEFSHVSKKMSELGEELKAEFSKKKSKKKQYGFSGESQTKESNEGEESEDDDEDPTLKFRNAASEGVHILGAFIKGVIDVLAAILKPLAYAIGIALILFLAIFWIATVGLLFFGMPFTSYIAPEPQYLSALGIINVLFLVGIPVLMGILMVMRIFMKTYFKPRWAAGLWVFWILNVVSFFFVGTKTAKDFSDGAETTIPMEADLSRIDTLVVEFSKNPYDASWMRIGDVLYLSDNKLISTNVPLRVKKSESGKFEITQTRSARGSSPEVAKQLADAIDFQYSLEGNTLKIPSYYVVEQGHKWRVQEVGVTIQIPEGKWIRFEGGRLHGPRELDINHKYDFPYGLRGYTAQMTANGLVSHQYLTENEHYQMMDGISSIKGEGPLKFSIVKGDIPLAHISRGEHFSENVHFTKNGNSLLVSADEETDRLIEIEVIVPSIENLEFLNTDDVEISGFDLNDLVLRSEGDQEIRGDLNVQNLSLDLSGEVKLRFNGVGKRLKAKLTNDSRMDVEDFKVGVAEVSLSDESFAKLSVSDTLYQSVGEDCELKVLTSPVVVNK